MNRRTFLQTTASVTVPLLTGITQPVYGSFTRAIDDKPWFAGYAGIHTEQLHSQAQVIGSIPQQLRGSLYRNGPAQHEVYGFRYTNWFDGDGMVHKYTISDTGISHLGKMVATNKYTREKKAKRALYPTFDSIPPNPEVVWSPDQVNAANISMLSYNDELLALWEAGSPYSIDSETLETLHTKQWSKETAGLAFSAHPRIDANGELWNFGYMSSAGALLIWHIGTQGTLKRTAIIHVNPITMPHDFVITEKHIIIPLAPFDFDTKARGKTFLASHNWHPKHPTRVLVIDKNSLQLTMTLELPAQWIFHYSNAWEDAAGIIHFEAPRAKDPGLMTHFFREVMQGNTTSDQSWASLYSYTIDTKRKRASEHRMFGKDKVCEFPVINKRYSTKKHDMLTILTRSKENPTRNYQYLDSVSVIHLSREREDSYTYPEYQIPEEHIFIPSRDARRESQGWIVGTFLDYRKHKTGLNIFDAERITEGPLATATLPYLIPLGLHGTFVPA